MTWVMLIVVGVCVSVQIALGADLAVLTLAMIASLAGIAGFYLAGPRCTAGWLTFFFVLGNAIIALAAKTAFLQPLDSYLYGPLVSFAALAAGSAVLLLALIVSLMIPVGRAVFRPAGDPRVLRFLSNSTFVVGTVFWYLNRMFQDPDGSGFGGIGVFWNLVLMAVITRTAMLLEQSGDRRSIDGRLVLMLIACVAMGMLDNSKTVVALPIVAYFATSVFYRGGVTLRQAGAGALGLMIMAAVIGPMIHAYRVLGIQEVGWRERVGLIERGLANVSINGLFERYEHLSSSSFSSGYSNYFGDNRGQMLLGRYASIQHIDPVIATISKHGTVGGTVIWPSFARLVPSFISPDKPRNMEGYKILVHLGLIDPQGGKFPTVPLLAQSYAGYGIVGLLVIPFFTFLGFLLALKKLGWRLHRNVFAIFFFCMFVVVYGNQGDLSQYSGAVLREFPLLAAALWVLIRVQYGRIRLHSLGRALRV